MPSLYELNITYSELQAMLSGEIETQEEEFAILDALGEVTDSIEEKADGYAKIIRNMTAEAEGLKAEEDRLAARRKRLESGVARLKQHLYNTMMHIGAKSIKTSIGSWSIRKNPPSVNVTDINKVPVRFLIEQPPKVDRAGMLKEFKQTGEIFDGVEIARSESLQLR